MRTQRSSEFSFPIFILLPLSTDLLPMLLYECHGCIRNQIHFTLDYSFSMFIQQGVYVLGIIQNHFPVIIKIPFLGTISEESVFFFSHEDMAIMSIMKITLSLQMNLAFVKSKYIQEAY